MMSEEEGTSQAMFQSRAGFSECLDILLPPWSSNLTPFQSRAGFSECLDVQHSSVL